MRRATALLAIIALLAAPAAVLAADELTADLTPDAEVPAPTVPDDYEGMGSATVTISDDESQISYEVNYEGLTGPVVASHIHYGAEGEAGPVILPLAHGDSPFSGTLTEADFVPVEDGSGPQTFAEALEAMRNGETYVNVHTEANPPGEIRGQLMLTEEDDGPAPTPPDTATSAVDGSSEAPLPTLLLLALVAAAGFIVAVRRFAPRSV